jgi:hypothetical protein
MTCGLAVRVFSGHETFVFHNRKAFIRFEVFTAIIIKIMTFWVEMPCDFMG